jgi:hypothetical protein
MDSVVIPSLLQSRLDGLKNSWSAQQPFFIEVGKDAVPIASLRSLDVGLSLKKTQSSASNPNLLLLMSQEHLAQFTQNSSFTLLSENEPPRSDLKSLSKRSSILVTTPNRAIDHLRRENLSLKKTKLVIVAYDLKREEEESSSQRDVRAKAFLDDCRFIFTKLNQATGIELYLNSLSHLMRDINDFSGKSFVLSLDEWEKIDYKISLVSADTMAAKNITNILYGLNSEPYFVIHETKRKWETLSKRMHLEIPPIVASGEGFENLDSIDLKTKNQIHTIVTINLNLEQLLKTIRHLNELKQPFQNLVAIVKPAQVHLITRSKEKLLMNTEIKPELDSNEILAGKIQMLAAKLTVDSNPEELEELKKAIRKNVPFLRRGYFSAYLLRELLNTTEKRGRRTTAPTNVTPKTTPANKPNQRGIEIPPGSRTLYLNIGKMRRLYAKEISQIFQDKLNINRQDIYAIRVHDKYSFITLSQENADKAIEKLNGIEIRGRVASVSYSNKE